MEAQKNVMSILVNNKPDVLARISGMFSGRNFNIESISANVARDPGRTKIIITTLGDSETQARILKQISKLVDIIAVDDLTQRQAVRREMLLVRVNWGTNGNRKKVEALAERKRWKTIYAGQDVCILEITGENGTLTEEMMLLEGLGMEDFTRTGVVAIENNVAEPH
jgi:acetolactate synthase-1/3 small subunit